MIADTFAYWGYSLGWATVRKMPERRAYALFERFADQTWRNRGKSVVQYERNLRRVVPDAGAAQLRELSRAGFRSYARYWCDAFRMPDWPRERILSFRLDNAAELDGVLARGNGLVIACSHSGNYDHGAAYMARKYGSMVTVAERLKPYRLFDKFVAFRQSMGLDVLGTGDPDLIEELVGFVRRGKIIGLVSERDLSRRGIPVTFFGEPTRFPAGPALVARRSGAGLIAANFFYEGDVCGARVLGEIEVPRTGSETEAVAAATQQFADLLTGGIRQHPTDWHMLQPLWLADLDPARDPMRRESVR